MGLISKLPELLLNEKDFKESMVCHLWIPSTLKQDMDFLELCKKHNRGFYNSNEFCAAQKVIWKAVAGQDAGIKHWADLLPKLTFFSFFSFFLLSLGLCGTTASCARQRKWKSIKYRYTGNVLGKILGHFWRKITKNPNKECTFKWKHAIQLISSFRSYSLLDVLQRY